MGEKETDRVRRGRKERPPVAQPRATKIGSRIRSSSSHRFTIRYDASSLDMYNPLSETPRLCFLSRDVRAVLVIT